VRKYQLAALCLIMSFLFLTACQSNNTQEAEESDTRLTEEAPVQERPSSEGGITLSTEKARYSSSVDTIVVEIQNEGKKEYMTGAHVFLEKKVEDTWYKVPMKADVFTEEAIIHPPGEESSLGFQVSDLKYELTPGEYRATISGLAAPFKVVE
jgi:hypothetical protein